MKTQSKYEFIPDWEVLRLSENKTEINQETEGIEEDREYKFYNSDGKDPGSIQEDQWV